MSESGGLDRAAAARFARYQEYKDSGVEWLGEIPAHWEVAALQYRYQQSLGKMLDTKRITGRHLVPYLRNVDVQWDHINLSDLPSMDIRSHELERYTVRQGDLLVCEGGEAGRCAIWHGQLDPCGYQKALHRLRPRDSLRDAPRFLYYTLSAAVTQDAFSSGQGTTIGHLTGDMLRVHRFPFPPASEQHAIVLHLDRETAKIDALVAKQEELIGVLKEKRSALVSHAVTKGLDPDVAMKDSGVEWLGEIPAHWEVRRLKSIAEMRSGDAITALEIESDGDYPVYGGNGVRGYVEYYTHDGDHVLIGRQGAHCGNVHLASGRFWASEHALVVSLGASTSTRWLAGTLASMDLNQHSVSAAQPGLAVERLTSLPIPLPLLSERRAIADHLDRETVRLDAIVAKARECIHRLGECRTALISAAVTGQIDVRCHNYKSTVPARNSSTTGRNSPHPFPPA